MRIAFFADSYKPYLSGVTNYIEILSGDLRRLGHQVYILAPYYPGYTDHDTQVLRYPSIPSGYPNFRLALPCLKQLPEVDLVHSQSPFQVGWLAKYFARRKKVPLVYTFHTLFTRYVHYARFVPEPLAKAALVAYLRTYCRGVDAIVCPSEMAKRVLRSWKINQRIEVLASGIDLQKLPANRFEIRSRLRQKYRLPEEAIVLLYTGRLTKEKNIPFLVEAIKQLSDKKVFLVLVGRGPLEKEIKANPHPQIVLTGEIPYPEILSHYYLGDIFVFSSLTETQGLVLAEAKAAGLPVVALFAGGLTGTVRSGIDGYLVPRNLETFVGHLRRLITTPTLREKMGRAAQADAQERFSSINVAKKVESVYNSLIDSTGGTR